MNVKITHTIKYEEVPDFVQDKIKQCRDRLSDLCGVNIDFLGSSDAQRASEKILMLRHELSLIDMSLDDCINIISGYQEVQMQRASQALAEASAVISDVAAEEGGTNEAG
jgi:hypothetical protein